MKAFYTNTTRVNYFLFICTGFEVSQSRVIAILNKLPNLTALTINFNVITHSEKEVRMCNSTQDVMCVFVSVCVALMLIFVYVLKLLNNVVRAVVTETAGSTGMLSIAS